MHHDAVQNNEILGNLHGTKAITDRSVHGIVIRVKNIEGAMKDEIMSIARS